jgi:hypothetical protein
LAKRSNFIFMNPYLTIIASVLVRSPLIAAVMRISKWLWCAVLGGDSAAGGQERAFRTAGAVVTHSQHGTIEKLNKMLADV